MEETTVPGRVRSQAVALADFIALNNEIAALSKAGASLESGLLDYARDSSGGLARIAKRLGERMTQGASLADAVAEESRKGGLPPLYQAVVVIGLKSGRLPAALEEVAKLAQGTAETRKAILQAIFYPLIIIIFTYMLFILMVTELVPRYVEFAEGMRIAVRRDLLFLAWLGETVWYWGFGLPIVLTVGSAVWIDSGRGAGFQQGRFERIAGLIPWARSALSQARAASFADLLALLIDHEVPLEEALTLAGEATGQLSYQNATRRAAEAIRQGDSSSPILREARALPALLRWLIATPGDSPRLAAALRTVARNYRSRSIERARLLRSALPPLFLSIIGGGMVAVYATALFLPIAQLYQGLFFKSY